MPRLIKPILLIAAVMNLVVGMLSGLGRLGWSVPLPEAYAHHGAIMVGGFLGSLIALEKIIPLKQPWFFVGPLLSVSSIFVFILGDLHVALGMQLAAGVVFLLVYLTYLRTQSSIYLLLALVGALCWTFATAMLFWKTFYPMVFPWYIGFLLFTIVSERLELSRFLPVTASNRNFLYVFLMLFMVGILLPFHGVGKYLAGTALILISSWLMRYDVIRLTIKKEGLARFTAVVLLCGYVALMLEGMLLLFLGDIPFGYDMIVHTFFLGFVFCMIFAHGPIILPGVLGLSVKPYHPLLYLPVVILLGSLIARLLADAFLIPLDYRALSGWSAMAGILLYFMMMAFFTLRAVRAARV